MTPANRAIEGKKGQTKTINTGLKGVQSSLQRSHQVDNERSGLPPLPLASDYSLSDLTQSKVDHRNKLYEDSARSGIGRGIRKLISSREKLTNVLDGHVRSSRGLVESRSTKVIKPLH